MPRHRDPTRCPSCGARVQPLAAGCAVCGADLDQTRFDHPSVLERLRRSIPSSYGAFWLVAFLAVGFAVYLLSLLGS